ADFNPLDGKPWDQGNLIEHAEALLFVANGVTTVRNMWGDPLHLKLRIDIDAGRILGPRIYTVGNINDGTPSIWPHSREDKTPEDAARGVLEDKQAGYDAVKVYGNLSLENYRALVSAARANDLPVYGHVPAAVGLSEALRLHQDSIEHLTGYPQALRRDGAAA